MAGANMNVEEANEFSVIRESVSLKHGHYVIFSTVLFFHIINRLVRSQGPPKSLTQDEWKWRNLMVSWIHAIIVSIWVITCTFMYPELYSDLLQHINHLTFFCVCFSTGYFVYDFLDLIVNNKFFAMWELLIHHIGLAGMFYYNLYTKAQIGFSMVALAVEVNSVFLHWRKLLLMVKTPVDSTRFILIKYLNLITFLIFRGGALVAISTGCILWRSKVSTLYYIGITTTTFFMDVLNIILFWRLFKSDILRSRKQTSTRSTYVTHKLEHDSQKNGSNNHVITSNNNCVESVQSRKTNSH